MAYSTINKPTDYFNTVLYSGTGSSNSVTGVGFQPDWTWIKSRNNTRNHNVYDSVRGTTKVIYTDLTNAESTQASGLTAFNSDGFTVVSDLGVNGASDNYASWNWLAGGSASSNTDGSITSSVSANTTSGFSVVSYTGTGANATVGHGLGAAPTMIFVKKRSVAGGDWVVSGDNVEWTKYLYLNSTQVRNTNNFFQDTAPTSSVFTLSSDGGVNQSSTTFVAYCFVEKKGYSKFGSYTGNGNNDGAFIYTGFKPAMIIIKDTSAVNNWRLFDNKRPAFNQTDKLLFPSVSNAETVNVAGSGAIDITSNGFKCRSSAAGINGSGSTFIYMAFAERSLVGTNGVPALAR